MKRLPVYVLSVCTVLLLWQAVSRAFFSPALFPGPAAVALKAAALIEEGQLQRDLAASLRRVLTGFALGSLIGASIGLLVGVSGTARTILDPYVHFLRFITPIAWISPVMIWFGIGETSKIVLITYTTTFAVMISTLAGVAGVPRNRLRAARACGATPLQIFLFVVVPSALAQILVGMRLAMGYSFMTVVPAEMLAAETGLGYLIINSRLWLATDAIFVGILVLGTVGLLMDASFRVLLERVFGRYTKSG